MTTKLRKHSITALLVATPLVVGVFAVMHYLQKPIRDAKQIQQGDTVDHVHQLLGTQLLCSKRTLICDVQNSGQTHSYSLSG